MMQLLLMLPRLTSLTTHVGYHANSINVDMENKTIRLDNSSIYKTSTAYLLI